MSATTFDTHQLVKTLEAAGASPELAEAIVRAQVAVIADALQNTPLASLRDLKEVELGLRRDTKEVEATLQRDLKELETTLRRDAKEMEGALRRETKELELRLTTRIADAKADIVKWVAGLLLAQSAVIATLVKLS